MNKSNISLDELAEIYGVKKDQSSWYFWSQHRDITLRDEFKVLLNYKINQKEVDLYTKDGTYVETKPLDFLISKAKEVKADVIQISPPDTTPPKVIIDRFSNYDFMAKKEIGLYSKPRPWLTKSTNQKQIGLKVLTDGIPRSSEKQDKKNDWNEKYLFHPKHPENHNCRLNKDSRVLKHLRKAIKIKASEFICNEDDQQFLKEVYSNE